LAACRRSWRLYGHANFSVSTGPFQVPIVGRIGLGNVNYRSLQFQEVLKAVFAAHEAGTVVDVGANVGKFLLNLAHVDPSAPYVGFEPLLPAAAYVRRLITQNRLSNHSIVAVALSDRCGTASIRFGSESDASATLNGDMRPPSMYPYSQKVATSTFDLQTADIAAMAFVKIDVEGAELAVLRGMTGTIARHRPPILIEVLPSGALLDGTYERRYFGSLPQSEALRVGEARRANAAAVHRFFLDRDYRTFSCSPEGRVSPVSSLDDGGRSADTDFFILPSERADALLSRLDVN
jgi:FkbM family methyltransferase